MHKHGGHWLVQITPAHKSKNKRIKKSALKVKIWLCSDVRHIQLMMERLENVLATSLDTPAIFPILIFEPCLKLNGDTQMLVKHYVSVIGHQQTRDAASPVITIDMKQRRVTLSCNISKGQKTAYTICLFFFKGKLLTV